MQYGNKLDELHFCVQPQGHDLTVITEMQLDSSHNWNAVMDGYVLRKDRQQSKVVEFLFT